MGDPQPPLATPWSRKFGGLNSLAMPQQAGSVMTTSMPSCSPPSLSLLLPYTYLHLAVASTGGRGYLAPASHAISLEYNGQIPPADKDRSLPPPC
nr:hypothetical protein Iba_chr13cCG13410 [Ipomoea batatas]